jgi:hypothetical protein
VAATRSARRRRLESKVRRRQRAGSTVGVFIPPVTSPVFILFVAQPVAHFHCKEFPLGWKPLKKPVAGRIRSPRKVGPRCEFGVGWISWRRGQIPSGEHRLPGCITKEFRWIIPDYGGGCQIQFQFCQQRRVTAEARPGPASSRQSPIAPSRARSAPCRSPSRSCQCRRQVRQA